MSEAAPLRADHGHEHGQAPSHTHSHAHSHAPAQVRRANLPYRFSLLRLSAAARLAGAGLLSALIWALAFWAMRP
ncbi:MAG: hypothetical protein KGL46_01880 [Hyphomicrobiales bacterium]|nr:hypothetical protein [Hyphomicrobiales bacterium]